MANSSYTESKSNYNYTAMGRIRHTCAGYCAFVTNTPVFNHSVSNLSSRYVTIMLSGSTGLSKPMEFLYTSLILTIPVGVVVP